MKHFKLNYSITNYYVLLFVLLGIDKPANAQFAGGAGTEGDPYQIGTVVQLDSIRHHLSAHFILIAHIEMDVSPYNTGSGWTPVGSNSNPFTGTLDGNNFEIRDLFVDIGSEAGLFGFVGLGGELINIMLLNINVAGGFSTGGLVGYNYGGTISYCSSTGNLSGEFGSGGLVGTNDGGSISYSYSLVQIDGAFNDTIGGLVGYNYSGTISNSYALGSVSGAYNVGGLVGSSDDSIKHSFAGGLVTTLWGSGTGGLIGSGYSSKTINSYWNILETGQATSAGGTGLTGLEQIDTLSYTDWDFESTWSITNGSYPWLQGNPQSPLRTPILFTGGKGTEGDPYLISTVEDLEVLHDSLHVHVKLANNIDLSTETGNSGGVFWNGGLGWEPLGDESSPFSGSFDGNNFTISGLTLNRPTEDKMGFFGEIGSTGEVTGLALENVHLTGKDYTGALVGYNAGSLTNIEVTGQVNGENNIGGLAGQNNGSISDAVVSGEVNGKEYVGGLVGSNSNNISNSSTNITINASRIVGGIIGLNTDSVMSSSSISTLIGVEDENGSYTFGGVVGENNGFITQSFTSSAIQSTVEYSNVYGGFVGSNNGTISKSYASTTVDVPNGAGGFSGGNHYSGTISDSYATGTIKNTSMMPGTAIGGFITSNAGTISNSYTTVTILSPENDEVGGFVSGVLGGSVYTNVFWNTETSQVDTAFSISFGDATGINGLASAQMLEEDSFDGFDFEMVWDIYEGSSFPFLRGVGNQLTSAANITGNAGWRMLSAPYDSISYATMLDSLWTQGYTGADTTGGASNVYTWDEATQAFQAITNADDFPEPGTGFIVYVYKAANKGGDNYGFPKTLLLEGENHTNNITPTLSYTDDEDGSTTDDGWNLMGNPYAFPMDWDAGSGWTKSNIDNSLYMWSDADNDYLTWNGSVGSLGDGKVAPWQGFWVKAENPSPSISLTSEVKSASGILRKKAPVPHLQFTLSGNEMSSNAMVMFSDEASIGKDRLDAYQLQPLSPAYLSLYTVLENGTALDINAIPDRQNEPIIFPMDMDFSGMEGDGLFEITWKQEAMQGDWNIVLTDNITGHRIDLSKQSEYAFELSAAKKKSIKNSQAEIAPPTHQVMHPRVLKGKSTTTPRFTLTITPFNLVSTEIFSDLPTTVELDQNYPNPFNPSTTIQFGVPEATQTTLEMFDMLGRKVATLLNNETKAAGWHQVQFDARNLASGMYVYRLVTVDNVLIKKLTLIK